MNTMVASADSTPPSRTPTLARPRVRRDQPRPSSGELETNRPLLEAFRAGEKWALERVYQHYAPTLIRYLRRGFSFDSRGRRLRFRGSASAYQIEDWLHDVFLRAFEASARSSYDGLRPYGAYLERIARNRVLDELRRKEHELRVEVEEGPESLPDEQGRLQNPETNVRDRQLQAHLEAFVQELPDRERSVYEARFVEGREQRDVAQQLRLTDSKVKTSEKRIRTGFRKFLVRHGWIDQQSRGDAG